MTDQIDYHETVTVHLLGAPYNGGVVWRGPLFQAVRMVMAMPPEQQYVSSIYLYDGDDESIITFTDIKVIAERADFPSSGWVTLTSDKVYRYAQVPLQAFRGVERQATTPTSKPLFKQVRLLDKAGEAVRGLYLSAGLPSAAPRFDTI